MEAIAPELSKSAATQMASTQPRTFVLPLSSQRFSTLRYKGKQHVPVAEKKSLDVVYRYCAESDALSIYFKKLREDSIDYTKPATEDKDFLLDYSDGLIVKAEFVFISDHAGCHFLSTAENIGGRSPFAMEVVTEGSSLSVLFTVSDPAMPILANGTEINGVSLLVQDGKWIGFEIDDTSKVFLREV